MEPAIFLLDEPLSNVDAAFRAVMRTELKHLQRAVPADHGLRHPRPARSHDHGRPHRRHGPRRAAAGRHAGRGLQQSGQHLRRPLHRRARHEPPARACRPRATAASSSILARSACRRRSRTACAGRCRAHRREAGRLRLPAGAGGRRARAARGWRCRSTFVERIGARTIVHLGDGAQSVKAVVRQR